MTDLVDWADVAALRDWLEELCPCKREDGLYLWCLGGEMDLTQPAARIRARDEYARRDEREKAASEIWDRLRESLEP